MPDRQSAQPKPAYTIHEHHCLKFLQIARQYKADQLKYKQCRRQFHISKKSAELLTIQKKEYYALARQRVFAKNLYCHRIHLGKIKREK